MFGAGNVQSSWANNNNQQQQPQQPNQGGSVFGQPSGGAFGSTSGAFGGGGTGAFGQAQPAQNSVFGAGNTGGGGAFGSFGGAANNNQAQTGGLFGAAKPATTGFGAFGGGGGGTNAFGAGGGGAFGTPANTASTSAFGASSGTGAFGGSGGGAFGVKPAGVFGAAPAAPANPNAGPYDGVPPVTTGSSNPPYSVFTDKDAANPNLTLQYQSITCMPQYRGNSFEELRWQDYQQGRKTASAGGFGTTAFGQAQPAATGSVFGAAPAQPAQNTGSAFGAFGGGTTGGAFGQQNTASTGFGAFGQQNQQQQQQQPAAPTFGAFGQPNQQQQQQQPAGAGLFGASNTGAFGAANNNQPKPFGAFGGTGTGAFGAANTNAGGGLFGQNNQQQQQQQQQPAAGGLFGQNNNQQQNPGGAFGGTGAFGQAKPAGGLFGAATGSSAFGGGAFGANNQQQNQQQPGQTSGLFGASNTNAAGGGLFGQNNQAQNQNQPAAGGGLFGAAQNNNQQQQPAAGGGLFGQNNAASGGGLFGQNNQNQQQQGQSSAFGGGGLFGAAKPAAPAGGGLFGSTANTGGGLFGQNNANANTGAQPAGGGLFGNSTLGQNPAQPAQNAFGGGGGLFGAKPAASTQPANGLGNSAFGASTFTTSQLGGAPAGGAQQPSLQPSISQPVATNLPIFSMLSSTAGASGVNLDQSAKKKSSLFEAPVSSPRPHVPGYQPAQSQKLRGYASTMRASTPNGNGLNFSLTAGKPNVLNFSVSGSRIGPDAFTTSAVQGSGASKSSVKKLILDKKVDPTELLRRTSSSPAPGRASFNPALSIQHREREASAAPQSPAPAPKRGTRFVGPTSSEIVDESIAGDRPLQEGDYWCRPSLQDLQALDFESLQSVPRLVVGRIGYGQIEFLADVDLTTLTKLSDLLGSQVVFETMECSVYPDSEDVDKPPPGAGLNVPARITLLRCFVLDKATRQPIKDENNERAKKHVARLRSMPGTAFEHFSIEDGKWTFRVEHF